MQNVSKMMEKQEYLNLWGIDLMHHEDRWKFRGLKMPATTFMVALNKIKNSVLKKFNLNIKNKDKNIKH